MVAFGDLATCPGFALCHLAFELVEDFFDVPAKLVDEHELVGGDGDLLITSTGLASLQDAGCRGLFSGGIARWAQPPATRCHPSGMKEAKVSESFGCAHPSRSPFAPLELERQGGEAKSILTKL